jgi:hypothetical protein
MNKRRIIASLNKIANELDQFGQHDEANSLTKIMIKLSQEQMPQTATTPLENSNQKIPKETVANLRNMAKNIQDVSLTCQSLLNNDEISQSHIDSLTAAEKDLTPFKNIIKMYIGKRLM